MHTTDQALDRTYRSVPADVGRVHRGLIKAEVAVAPVADFKDLAEIPRRNACQALVVMDDSELGTLRMPDVQPRLSERPGTIRYAGATDGCP
jgi:crotonobetainyl-CoA:carnitine CoA-transferase CaiB-like acyl-CoA transferase